MQRYELNTFADFRRYPQSNSAGRWTRHHQESEDDARVADHGLGATDPASPWAYGDKVFCLSEDGDCFVIEHGPEYRLVGKNSVGELCMATPAIAKGSLILRGAEHLYRIGA